MAATIQSFDSSQVTWPERTNHWKVLVKEFVITVEQIGDQFISQMTSSWEEPESKEKNP